MRILVALSLLLCTACLPISAPFHIYPIGEAASSSPIPCRFKIHFGWQSATIIATLPRGETFSAAFDIHVAPPDREMAPFWDKVFGAGYFNAKVLGSRQHFRIALRSAQGQEMQMELHGIPGDHRGGLEGVAVDGKHQLYKAGY